jgi:hypothetical protein
MSPLSLRRQNGLACALLPNARCLLRLQPKRRRAAALQTRPANPHVLWTAPAERSDDGAFARTTISGNSHAHRALKAVSRFACHRTPNTPGESARPMDCGDMSPLSLHRQNGPACVPTQRSVHSRRAAKAASCRRTPKHARANQHALWTAPAERSDDGAFARTTISGNSHPARALQSGVALRLPPHSKTRPANPHALWTAVTCHRFCCTARMVRRVSLPSVRCILGVQPKRRRAAALQNTPGEPARPVDCAGRAQRRRRFRTHHDPVNLPRRSRVPKRCRASLATALQNTLGRIQAPYGLR